MAIRTPQLVLAVLACAAVAVPIAVAPASDVHAARATAGAKPKVGHPYTKMRITLANFGDGERISAVQTITTPFDNVFTRRFRYRAGTDGTLEITLRRPQILGRYKFCFTGRSSKRKACAFYRIEKKEDL